MKNRILLIISCLWLAAPVNVGTTLAHNILVDLEKVYKQYRHAAEQGHPDAQYELGKMYVQGEGVAENDTEAAKWWRKAAKQGHARAQYELGFMHQTGRGVARDNKEAYKWYHQAAAQGVAEAQHFLGVMYYFGDGVMQSDTEAYKWALIAQANGLKGAEELIETLKPILSPAQIAAAQKELLHYMQQ